MHLWVEGFFEVFATAVIALIFTRLGLVAASSANRAIVMETIVFLFGGILGTLHHLYWTGTPTSVIAVGAVFSALEVVPLALIGVEAFRNYRRSHAAPWVAAYRWPILCFVAVGFWNTVGAGLLGFAINPPASLYYVQGLNMTPAHGHAALFGVYGMLGIGLMLFCLRGLYERSLPLRIAARARVLGPEHRARHDGVPVAAARGHLPGVAQRLDGPVVRALAGDHPLERDGDARVAARARRHGVRLRARVLLGVYAADAPRAARAPARAPAGPRQTARGRLKRRCGSRPSPTTACGC